MKTFVLGDPHGGLKAIKQVLERCKFDFEKDRLICLGDIADGWPEAAEALEFLIKEVKNLVYVRGNHDQWLKDWLKVGKKPDVWTFQGGIATQESYLKNPQLRAPHLEFLKNTPCYFIDEKNRVYCHGGFHPRSPVTKESKHNLMWDRDLWMLRHTYEKVEHHFEVYVGHTSIWNFSKKPLRNGNVWFMDTGGGCEGKLSIMDVDSKEIWQSDLVRDLYPESPGRIGINKCPLCNAYYRVGTDHFCDGLMRMLTKNYEEKKRAANEKKDEGDIDVSF